jgi:hypothetical protein
VTNVGGTRTLGLLTILMASLVVMGMLVGGQRSVHNPWSKTGGDPHTAVVTTSDGLLSILWLGDTMLGDAAQKHMDREGDEWPLDKVRPFLGADFVIANAEAPITNRGVHWSADQPWTYHSLPASAHALARSGIDAVGLRNNHALDRGPDGLLETLENARAAGL